MSEQRATDRYWKTNIRIVLALLSVWFFVSYVCGIFLVEWLNQWHIAGFPIGFWFAQQGSIIVFIGLILTYCLIMDRLDARLVARDEDK